MREAYHWEKGRMIFQLWLRPRDWGFGFMSGWSVNYFDFGPFSIGWHHTKRG